MLYEIGEFIYRKNNFRNLKNNFEKNKNNFIKIFSMKFPTYEIMEKSDQIVYCLVIDGSPLSFIENSYVKYRLETGAEFALNMNIRNVISKFDCEELNIAIMSDVPDRPPCIYPQLPLILDPFLQPSVL